MLREVKDREKKPPLEIFFFTYLVENDPTSFLKANDVLDAKYWDKAIRIEIDSIKQNNTWTIVDMSKGAKLIGCKWIFKKKISS